MPNLMDHQLRVASVAQTICENFELPIRKDDVVLACLLHDMGNIIKFDLTHFPQFLEPQGLEYWEKVKAEYIVRYGKNEHRATEEIARELGASDAVMQLLAGTGYSKLDRTEAEASYERKIVAYSDMRVGPHGVISIAERVEDGRRRYAGKKDKAISSGSFDRLNSALMAVEKQIFAHTSIRPEDIADASLGDTVDKLRKASVTLYYGEKAWNERE